MSLTQLFLEIPVHKQEVVRLYSSSSGTGQAVTTFACAQNPKTRRADLSRKRAVDEGTKDSSVGFQATSIGTSVVPCTDSYVGCMP